MRKLLTVMALGLGFGLACGAAAYADQPAPTRRPDPSHYEDDVVIRSTGKGVISPRQRVCERAAREASERETRIEYFRQKGMSLQRPSIYGGPFPGSQIYQTSAWAVTKVTADPLGIR
jgi:hypothetical protein